MEEKSKKIAKIGFRKVNLSWIITERIENIDRHSLSRILSWVFQSSQVVEYFLPIGRIVIEEVARAESKNVQDKIIGTLKRYNGLIKQRDLLRVLHMKVKEVDESIEALMLSEEIERQVVKSKKGNVLYYKLRECHSDIVSHKGVYKENNEGGLYTHPCGTKTLCHMGHDQDKDVDVGRKEAAPSPAPKEDPDRAKFKAKVQCWSQNTCRLCGAHFEDPLSIGYHGGGYICERCRRDGAPAEPPKADAQTSFPI